MTMLRKYRTQLILLGVFLLLLLLSLRGMPPRDWVITLMRGFSVGAVTFLVAAGFSLIFGLLDVLNLAHGTLFMIGAYIGWTVYVRPDTFVDILAPVLLILSFLIFLPLWSYLLQRLPEKTLRPLTWFGLSAAVLLLLWSILNYPITAWNAQVYERSPVTYAFLMDQKLLVLPEPLGFENASPILVLVGMLLGGLLLGVSLAALGRLRHSTSTIIRLPGTALALGLLLLISSLLVFVFNTPLTNWLFSLDTIWLFLLAVAVATVSGAALGGLMETSLIRPLYVRPIYQLMLTLGLSAIGIEVVRAIWGRPEFTMPKPSPFNATGPDCPAQGIGDWLINHCSTIEVLGGRMRTYNEIFIPLVGVIVLVAVWLLLQRTRLGMVIRAGVQDREMVEALGINVRRIFTLVFALGVGLAALGGILAAPSMGLSNHMGEILLLNALIALAIGGLTSFPGAAAGAMVVGLLQQFIIKYGQIGINLPFLEEPFKPTPPLVPASTVLLMVLILLILPQGLFGRKE